MRELYHWMHCFGKHKFSFNKSPEVPNGASRFSQRVADDSLHCGISKGFPERQRNGTAILSYDGSLERAADPKAARFAP